VELGSSVQYPIEKICTETFESARKYDVFSRNPKEQDMLEPKRNVDLIHEGDTPHVEYRIYRIETMM
jgi:3-phenylpropionate/cinnamic acid dioxygenase small subunit